MPRSYHVYELATALNKNNCYCNKTVLDTFNNHIYIYEIIVYNIDLYVYIGCKKITKNN